MIGFGSRRVAVAALLASTVMVGDADAQAFTLAGGARLFGGDDGVSATMAALRTEFPIGGAALIEFASSISETPQGARWGVSSVFEAQVQLPVRLGDVLTPYVGAGAGMGHVNEASGEIERGWQGVFSAGAGVRVALADQLGVVVDARLRGIGLDVAGDHTDVTVGLRYQLNRPDRPRFRGAP